MKHLLRILEVQHIKDNEVIWEAFNIPNTLHLGGEQFMISALFRSAAGISVPSFYYIGMDNRSTVSITDNMGSLTTEPASNGYSRQAVSSATGFIIEEFTVSGDTSGIQHWRARSQILAFTATGGSWGPVSNVFLTNRNDNGGYLISTASLGTTRTVGAGETLNFRFALNLINES